MSYDYGTNCLQWCESVTNFSIWQSVYGLGLSANQSGNITYHFAAANTAGKFISSSISSFYFHEKWGSWPELNSNAVKISVDGVNWTMLGSNATWIDATVDLTSYVVGHHDYWVRFEAVAPSSNVPLVIDHAQFNFNIGS